MKESPRLASQIANNNDNPKLYVDHQLQQILVHYYRWQHTVAIHS